MRRRDREVTDTAAIRAILDKAQVVHLAMIDDDRPYVVPLHYGYTLENGVLTLYLHSAKEGRKLDVLQKNGRVAFVLETDVSSISGGEIPCKYGAAYASVMGEGKAVFLTDPAKKAAGLQILMKIQTGREFTITEAMTESVAVLRVDVETYSAKSRPLTH
jgi:nitroimidazol reductase NimA-like FMN-containing flavoprotein (pyridoxamine 5'-phosphate oxidase superfamily)